MPVKLTAYERNHHTLITGTTGTGKSCLLNLIVRQILNHRAFSVDAGSLILFDPHWSLGPSVIDYMATCNMSIPLLVVDPQGKDIVAFDPLLAHPEVKKEVLADMFSAWLAHVWQRDSNNDMPRLEAGCKLIVETLLATGCALSDAHALLNPDQDVSLRQGIVDRIADPVLVGKWRQLTAKNPSAFEFEMGSTRRAFNRIPRESRTLCGLGRTFRWSDVLNGGWVVIVRSGRAGGIGSALSSIMLDDLWHAVESRTGSFPPATLMIDDFLQVPAPSLSEYLPNARKRGMGCILALQSATQLTAAGAAGSRLFTEVNLNCNNKISLRLDAAGALHSAADLATHKDDLAKLKQEHAVVKSMLMSSPKMIKIDELYDFGISPAARDIYISQAMSRWRGRFVFGRSDADAMYSNRVDALRSSNASAEAEEPDEFEQFIGEQNLGD